jgi:exonuclease SbcC
VNDLVQRRLGMSRTEFFNTYFTGQKELSVMAAMGPTERAQFLSRVLGYERLRLAQDLMRERRRLIGAEIAGLRSGMADSEVVTKNVADAEAKVASCIAQSNEAGTRHAIALQVLRDVTPTWETAQKQREQWQRLLAEVTIAERDASAFTKELERLAAELAQIEPARLELETLKQTVEPLAAYVTEVQQLDELSRQQGRRQTLVENVRVLEDELAQLRERHAGLAQAPALEEEVTLELEKMRAELDQVQTALETRRTEWVRDRQEAETKLQELRRQYADVKQQRERVVTLGAEGVCPTCNRKLGATFSNVVDQLNEQLETLQVDGQYYRDRGEQLTSIPQDITIAEEQRRKLTTEVGQLERRLAKVQLGVQQLPVVVREIQAKETRLAETAKEIEAISHVYDGDRHAALRLEIERLTPLHTRMVRLSASVERAPALLSERERVTVEHERARERWEQLRAQGATTQFSERDYTNARDAFEQASAEARKTELAVVTAQSEVRAAQQTLDSALDAQREYARISETLATLNRDKRMHEELDRAFTDLRTDLNFQLRPELSELASAFLSDLTEDRFSRLELDDQYNIIVLEDEVAKPVISGGEEDLANLVLRLAISQMIAERAGQAFSLLILDEVFGSLDINRRENVIDLLRRIQDRFEQVILITHIESVRDGVDRVVTVRYDQETGSSVVEVTDDLVGDDNNGLLAAASETVESV